MSGMTLNCGKTNFYVLIEDISGPRKSFLNNNNNNNNNNKISRNIPLPYVH